MIWWNQGKYNEVFDLYAGVCESALRNITTMYMGDPNPTADLVSVPAFAMVHDGRNGRNGVYERHGWPIEPSTTAPSITAKPTTASSSTATRKSTAPRNTPTPVADDLHTFLALLSEYINRGRVQGLGLAPGPGLGLAQGQGLGSAPGQALGTIHKQQGVEPLQQGLYTCHRLALELLAMGESRNLISAYFPSSSSSSSSPSARVSKKSDTETFVKSSVSIQSSRPLTNPSLVYDSQQLLEFDLTAFILASRVHPLPPPSEQPPSEQPSPSEQPARYTLEHLSNQLDILRRQEVVLKEAFGRSIAQGPGLGPGLAPGPGLELAPGSGLGLAEGPASTPTISPTRFSHPTSDHSHSFYLWQRLQESNTTNALLKKQFGQLAQIEVTILFSFHTTIIHTTHCLTLPQPLLFPTSPLSRSRIHPAHTLTYLCTNRNLRYSHIRCLL